MITDELIKQFIDDRIKRGLLTFGWNDNNVKEYNLIGYRDVISSRYAEAYHIMIDCEYVDRGRLYMKAFQVRYTELQQFMRDNKLAQVLS